VLPPLPRKSLWGSSNLLVPTGHLVPPIVSNFED
jgi:hypothetical protein